MKKKFVAGLLLGLTASLGVACGGTDEITLVDFEATQMEEACKIGDTYELRRTVVDKNGKEYAVSYEVKDSDGKDVSIYSNCFEVTDLEGYTITYTVTISEDDVRTSVVTLPAYDGDAPVISFGSLAAGAVDEEYVLPQVTFSDLSNVAEKSVKVYRVGTELTEVPLSENEGVYSFLPTVEGKYRFSVYAKDAAGNETTRTADFIVEKILVGEVFNPAAANAAGQMYFGSNNSVFSGTEKEVVTAAENTDGTYGGSYMRAVAANPSGEYGNLLLSPRFDVSKYANFEAVTVWVYVESTANTPINVLFFNEASLTQSVTPNQWTLVSIDRATFFTHITNPQKYFIAVKYDEATTGIRLGEVLAANRAEVSISEPTGVVLNGASTDVEFTVSATPANTECIVSVQNAAGQSQETVALGNGRYRVTLSSVGEYVVTARATNGNYGVATKQFEVVLPNRIEVSGEYAESSAMGEAITLQSAIVKRGDEATGEAVTVKVYSYNGTAWIDVSTDITDGKYTPTAEGKIKVEYTFEDFTPIAYEIVVFDASVVFDADEASAPTQITLGTNNKVFEGSAKEFMSAEGNTDATYGGAYFRAVATGNGWGNVLLTPKHGVNVYKKYETLTVWLYVESSASDKVNVLFVNDAALTQSVTPNQWVQVSLPVAAVMKQIEAQYFCSLNFNGTVTGVRIGDISASGEVDPSFVFNPASANAAAQVTYGVNNALFTGSAKEFVSAEDNTDTTYGGAYLRAVPAGITSNKNQWGNVFLSPQLDVSAYAGYDVVTVWVYVESNGSAAVTVQFLNTKHTESIIPNQWVQVTIPIATFMQFAETDYFCGMNYCSNASWGVTGVRIGEIKAVKNG